MTVLDLPITTFAASVLTLWLVVLSARVIQRRMASTTSLGDGGDPVLERRIRAHGNLAENAPLFLILLALAEIQGAAFWVCAGLAAVFLAGRLSHGYALAFTKKNMRARFYGMVLTFTGLVGAAINGLLLALF